MSRRVFGLGGLDRWIHDDGVDEVLVNGGREVWIERRDSRGIQYVGRLDPGVVDVVIERTTDEWTPRCIFVGHRPAPDTRPPSTPG